MVYKGAPKPCVKHRRSVSILVGAVAKDSRIVSYELGPSFRLPIWCSGVTRDGDGEPALSELDNDASALGVASVMCGAT